MSKAQLIDFVEGTDELDKIIAGFGEAREMWTVLRRF